ncbi:hypothetical protein PCE1_001293 [Barthelona sp. PCE]
MFDASKLLERLRNPELIVTPKPTRKQNSNTNPSPVKRYSSSISENQPSQNAALEKIKALEQRIDELEYKSFCLEKENNELKERLSNAHPVRHISPTQHKPQQQKLRVDETPRSVKKSRFSVVQTRKEKEDRPRHKREAAIKLDLTTDSVVLAKSPSSRTLGKKKKRKQMTHIQRLSLKL